MIVPSEGGGCGERFPLGRVVITRNALHSLPSAEVLVALGRHARGDWGNVGQADRQANERAMAEGARLFSVYFTRQGLRFWIITEADRSRTTVLLPEDY